MFSNFFFLGILPEALKTNCLRCTEKQKVVTLRSIRRLRKEYPKVWAQLTELWDPTGEYIGRFEETFHNQNNQKPPTTTTPSNFVDLDNRFGDSSKVEVADINVPSVKPYPPPEYTPSTTTTTKPPPTTTTIKTTTNTPSTTTEAHTTTTKPTRKYTTTTPLTVTYGGGLIPNLVSFRPPDLSVKGIVQGLGSIGTQVIRAGTRIAGMLISSVQSVVGH